MFPRELRGEVCLDALPSLLELEYALALLLEALASGRGGWDLDPDLQLLLFVWSWRVDVRGFMSLTQIARVHRGGVCARAGEGCAVGLGTGDQWMKGIHAFVTILFKISVCGRCSSGAVICGLPAAKGWQDKSGIDKWKGRKAKVLVGT